MYKILLIIYFIFLVPIKAIAGNTVVISTLELKEGKSFWSSEKYSVYKKIEMLFQKNLLDEYQNIKFVHNASFKEILRELEDEKNDNIFFIGHGGLGSEKAGIIQESSILDRDGTPVHQFFFKAHKKLKFLAVISCNSKNIIETTAKKLTGYSFPASLKTITFDEKIEINKGIKESIARFKDLNNEDNKTIPTNELNAYQEDLVIKINKINNTGKMPSIVSIGGKIYSIFSGENEAESITFKMSSLLLKDDLMFSIEDDRGSWNSNKKLNFGHINEISIADYNCTLKPELNTRGELLGVTKHFYKVSCKDNSEYPHP